MPRIDLQTYLELKKIGVNLNQMAKKANSNILPYGIGQQLKHLLAQQQTLINLLFRLPKESTSNGTGLYGNIFSCIYHHPNPYKSPIIP